LHTCLQGLPPARGCSPSAEMQKLTQLPTLSTKGQQLNKQVQPKHEHLVGSWLESVLLVQPNLK